jgi:hypothetical protein
LLLAAKKTAVWDNSRLLNVMGTKFANTQKVAILKFFPNHPYLGRAWMRSFFFGGIFISATLQRLA